MKTPKPVRISAMSTAIALSALGIAGCGSSSPKGASNAPSGTAMQSLKVTYYEGALQSFPAYLANQLGEFKKQGLKVELLNVQGGPAGVSAVVSKSADIMLNGADNVTLARAAKDGPDFIAVGGNTKNQVNALIARKGLATPSLANGYPGVLHDLKGKSIGVPARGSSLENITRMMLVEAGMNPDKDVKWISLGNAAATVAAFKAKKVDAALVPEPVITETVNVQHDAKMLVDLRTGKPSDMQWPFNMWWALRENVAAKSGAFEHFQTAMKATYAYMADEANRQDMLTYLEKFMGIDSATAKMYLSPLNLSNFGYEVPRAGMDRLWGHMKDLGLIASIPSYDKVVDPGTR